MYDLINIKGCNNLKPLHNYRNKAGVYIFLDKCCNISYIGSSSNLKNRIKEHLATKVDSSSLIKNILDINNLSVIKKSTKRKKQILLCLLPKILLIEINKDKYDIKY